MRKSTLFALSLSGALVAHVPDVEPPLTGNFSVSPLTQVSPLVSFGQLLIGEKGFLPELSGTYAENSNGYKNTIAPNFIYGIRDDFSIFVAVPYIPKSRSGASTSSGIGDMLVQLEYGYFTKEIGESVLQGTVVGNVQFPTGSSSKNPSTGNGAFAYFAGTTLSYLSHEWYAFISAGANLLSHGNSYLYQCGIAKYIKQLSPKGWVCNLMVEFDGTYSEEDTIIATRSRSSGGNVIFITPSIYLASNRWVLQWGIGFPLSSHQTSTHYSIDYNIGVGIQF